MREIGLIFTRDHVAGVRVEYIIAAAGVVTFLAAVGLAALH